MTSSRIARIASRVVNRLRRLSHAISEGEAISLLVQVDGADGARAAEQQGADGVFVGSGSERALDEIRAATRLPILFFFDGQRSDTLAGADACLVELDPHDQGWVEQVQLELSDFELAYRVTETEKLAALLERQDPELIVLGGAQPGEDQLEHLLDLLSDVPAGKLAIAELPRPSRDAVAELERAGVDAVLVGAGDVGELVDEPPPEV
jgi:hypothetical protein